MPSAKILETKKAAVAELNEKIKNSVSGVLVDYRGLTVEQDTNLRKQLREAGVEYKVIKNTLIRFALNDTGLEALDSLLENPTALAISADDEIAPAKILTKFASANNALEIKGGFLDGQVMSVDEVNELGKVPPRDQLIAQILGGLNAPIQGLAIVLKQIAEKLEEGGGAAPAAEEAAPEAPAAEEAAPEAPAAEEAAPEAPAAEEAAPEAPAAEEAAPEAPAAEEAAPAEENPEA